MPITKFVEVGRVVKVNYGPDCGKLGVIVNIANENRVLIDGDCIRRQLIPVKRLVLTKFQIKDVLVGQRYSILKKKIGKGVFKSGKKGKEQKGFNLEEKYHQTKAYKTEAAKAKRAKLSDFDRFKVMVLKRRLSFQLRKAAKASKKQGSAKQEKKAPKKK